MHPLKVIVADDEKEARELLLHYLPRLKSLEVKECADGQAVLKALQEFQPDILFLDIKMPELSGIEVLQQKKTTLLPAVIFTTAFDEYALSAFDYEVLDYLLKPFERERFDRAWKRALDYVSFVKNNTVQTHLTQLPVKTGVKTELVDMDEIIFFRAEGSYVQVITADKNYLITEPIYELESLVDPSKFARVHRSVIVQINAIKTIQSLLNGDHILILKNGKEIRASRTYKEKINQMKLF
jgi:two-component system LytT family response regulator